jgi:hypothetical protein
LQTNESKFHPPALRDTEGVSYEAEVSVSAIAHSR